MEPLTIVYISMMVILSASATTKLCEQNKIISKYNSKKVFKKKRFKHYRLH